MVVFVVVVVGGGVAVVNVAVRNVI